MVHAPPFGWQPQTFLPGGLGDEAALTARVAAEFLPLLAAGFSAGTASGRWGYTLPSRQPRAGLVVVGSGRGDAGAAPDAGVPCGPVPRRWDPGRGTPATRRVAGRSAAAAGDGAYPDAPWRGRVCRRPTHPRRIAPQRDPRTTRDHRYLIVLLARILPEVRATAVSRTHRRAR